jgi:hypothetical protein
LTEDKWLACTDPGRMLPFLYLRLSARKLRLLGVACCRAIQPLLPEETEQTAVTTAERYADGEVALSTLRRARSAARKVGVLVPIVAEEYDSTWPPPDLARLAGWGDEPFARARWELVSLAREFVDRIASPDLADRRAFPTHPYLPFRRFVSPFIIWDIVGNPFRPTPHDPSWLTSDVTALARGIYEQKAFDGTPALADALQEAGCDDEDVLDHLRSGGPHVRGCWALDMVLGKE